MMARTSSSRGSVARRCPALVLSLATLAFWSCIATIRTTNETSNTRSISLLLALSNCNNNSRAPTKKGGGLFYCGTNSIGLEQALFPDYTRNFMEHADDSLRSATSDDILVVGMHGSCKIESHNFPGKVLVWNGESVGDGRMRRHPNGFCQIGAIPESPQSVAAYYGAMLPYATDYFPSWNLLTNHKLKPRNTGKYHAVAYISSNYIKFREEAVANLSHILPVHYGAGLQGGLRRSVTNVVRMPNPPQRGTSWKEVTPSLHDYQFCIAMENNNKPFYITEKILNAFMAGCIPIYYGTTGVFDLFHRNAFVFYDVNQPEAALKQIKHLANNETAYQDMLRNFPILANGEETLRLYFSFSNDIGGGYLKHKIRTKMGIE